MESEDTGTVHFKITGTLKKFNAKPDGSEWTNEEINAGLADEYLDEVLEIEDDAIKSIWRKGE
jgi:hypothetical protein